MRERQEGGSIGLGILFHVAGSLMNWKRIGGNMINQHQYFGHPVRLYVSDIPFLMKWVALMASFLPIRKRLIFAGGCNCSDIGFLLSHHQILYEH